MANRDAAGETGLSGDDDVIFNAAIVGDVDHVVELDAVADGGEAEGGAVDAGVGAELDVVAESESADLREFFPAAGNRSKAEAIGAENDTGVEDGAGADVHAGIDCDARVQARLCADADLCPDRAV